MFEDGRSKKVVFIAHCLLNQNAISDGTAVRPAAFEQLAYALLERAIGIVQMQCPELCCLGLDRGDEVGGQRDVLEENTRIRAEMQKPRAHGRLTALVEQVMWQSMDRRLAAFLLEESALEHTDTLRLTHEQIANHLGTAREVVTRMLRYFQSEGMVRLSRGTVAIADRRRLEALRPSTV